MDRSRCDPVQNFSSSPYFLPSINIRFLWFRGGRFCLFIPVTTDVTFALHFSFVIVSFNAFLIGSHVLDFGFNFLLLLGVSLCPCFVASCLGYAFLYRLLSFVDQNLNRSLAAQGLNASLRIDTAETTHLIPTTLIPVFPSDRVASDPLRDDLPRQRCTAKREVSHCIAQASGASECNDEVTSAKVPFGADDVVSDEVQG